MNHTTLHVRSGNPHQILIMSSALSVGLQIFRMWHTDTRYFFFLNWNLFLAFIPWACTFLLMQLPNAKRRKLLLPVSSLWLAFFPNAPYILTDLYHLRNAGTMPVWFDMILILSYGWSGLLFGFLSLRELEKMWCAHFSERKIKWVIVITFFITAFGIYIGRFLRWNSWDIISNPVPLMRDITDRFVHPFQHPRTWGVTISMGLFLNLVWKSLKELNS
ncbi:MAG: DUF1361 domain-containing protein [Bacteroidetes bacterium]|nr:DUF1361 domain-containing protein [Bacteroidota bacterium]